MKLQLYNDDDFKIIQEWITDEKNSCNESAPT